MDNDPELDIERHRTMSSTTGARAATTSLVVGWDHESASGSALTFAVDLARRLAAHLHVVHIVDIDDLPAPSILKPTTRWRHSATSTPAGRITARTETPRVFSSPSPTTTTP